MTPFAYQPVQRADADHLVYASVSASAVLVAKDKALFTGNNMACVLYVCRGRGGVALARYFSRSSLQRFSFARRLSLPTTPLCDEELVRLFHDGALLAQWQADGPLKEVLALRDSLDQRSDFARLVRRVSHTREWAF